jgi:acyl-CoA synthetase (AMP-forming)/AMP-acid ligase II
MSFESLAQLAEYRALHDGDRIFLSSPEHQIDLTYREFYREAQKLVRHIERQGLRQGQRVALILENGLNWAVAFSGILLAGGVVVPLNPRLKPAETADLLRQADAHIVITVKETAQNLPLHLFTGGKQDTRYQTELDGQEKLLVFALQPEEVSEKNEEKKAVQAADEALLLFTSGSTGVPKGVVLTHGNLLAEADFIRQGHKLTPDDIVLCILPFFHINGLVITFITTLFSGGRAVVPRKFSARRFWDWARRYQVTWFSAVPTILSILLSGEDQKDIHIPSLRFARSASSSLPVAVLETFERRYHVPVIESYGLSEAASQVATNPLPPAIRKAGSVGRPAGN